MCDGTHLRMCAIRRWIRAARQGIQARNSAMRSGDRAGVVRSETTTTTTTTTQQILNCRARNQLARGRACTLHPTWACADAGPGEASNWPFSLHLLVQPFAHNRLYMKHASWWRLTKWTEHVYTGSQRVSQMVCVCQLGGHLSGLRSLRHGAWGFCPHTKSTVHATSQMQTGAASMPIQQRQRDKQRPSLPCIPGPVAGPGSTHFQILSYRRVGLLGPAHSAAARHASLGTAGPQAAAGGLLPRSAGGRGLLTDDRTATSGKCRRLRRYRNGTASSLFFKTDSYLLQRSQAGDLTPARIHGQEPCLGHRKTPGTKRPRYLRGKSAWRRRSARRCAARAAPHAQCCSMCSLPPPRVACPPRPVSTCACTLRYICTQLVRSGERERLKRLLREKLTECGWRDDIKQRCRGACARACARVRSACVSGGAAGALVCGRINKEWS